MKKLSLPEITECLGDIVTGVNGDITTVAVTSVSTDTRTIKRGELFIALVGPLYDGSDYIPVAVQKDACAIISVRKPVYTAGVPYITVTDGAEALLRLAAYHRSKFNIPVIAITGSAGKTTTKEMTACALSAQYKVYCSTGNMNNQVGVPKALLELDETYEAAVFELGMDHTGEIRRLSDIVKPDIAVITGIGKAHMGNLGSVANIMAAKLEIVCGLKPGGTLVISEDDEFLKDIKPSRAYIAEKIRKAAGGAGNVNPYAAVSSANDYIKVLRVSMDDRSYTADFVASHIALSSDEISFTLTEIKSDDNGDNDSFFAPRGFGDSAEQQERSSHICVIPVRGRHNVGNALHAFAAASVLDVDLNRAARSLGGFFPVAMRGDIAHIKGVTVLKDYYSGMPQSVRAALTTLAEFENNRVKQSGRKIAILGEMTGLGEYSADEHAELGEFCATLPINLVFFAGSSHADFARGIGVPKHKTKARISRPIENAEDKYAEGGEKSRELRTYTFPTKEEMLEYLNTYVRASGITDGDVILIKASRDEAFEDVYENLKRFINAEISDFIPLPPSPTRLYVNVNNMRHNYLKIREYCGGDVAILPMVKANAYGCGAEVISNIFGRCKFVAVADVKEAAIIRRSVPEMGIIIMYQPLQSDIPEIVANGYLAAASDTDFIRELNEAARNADKVIGIHIEIDTGHARLGINCDVGSCTAFAKAVQGFKNIRVDGIFAHYASADAEDSDSLKFTKLQTERFTAAYKAIEAVLGEVMYKHASSSAGTVNPQAAAEGLNMVRPGYAIYGYHPSDITKGKLDLRPALRHATRILQIRTVPKGTPVSYSRTYVTTRETRLATLAAGYSDGIPRLLSNKGSVAVNGQRAPIRGRVCMDLCMADITDIVGEVNVGDEVFLFDNVNVTVDEIAALSQTIGYEVLSRIEDKADKVEEF